MNGAGGSPKDRVALSIIKSVNYPLSLLHSLILSVTNKKPYFFLKDVMGPAWQNIGRRTRALKTTLGRHDI